MCVISIKKKKCSPGRSCVPISRSAAGFACHGRPVGTMCPFGLVSSQYFSCSTRFSFKIYPGFSIDFFFFLKKLNFQNKKLLHDLYTTTTLLVLLEPTKVKNLDQFFTENLELNLW